MSILSGFLKTKKYRKTSTGYKLQSEWTSGSSVEMADGNTAETNLGAIKGITDSLTATSSNVALSAKAGKSLQDQITAANSNLGNVTVMPITAVDNVSIGLAETSYLAYNNYMCTISLYVVCNAFLPYPNYTQIVNFGDVLAPIRPTLLSANICFGANVNPVALIDSNGAVKVLGVYMSPGCELLITGTWFRRQ